MALAGQYLASIFFFSYVQQKQWLLFILADFTPGEGNKMDKPKHYVNNGSITKDSFSNQNNSWNFLTY